MKAISLWQPWASAIACGSKLHETRSWPYPPSLDGQIIAIHAAKRWQRDEQELARALSDDCGIDLGYKGTPPLGVVVAVARLAGCFPTELVYSEVAIEVDGLTEEQDTDYLLGNYEPGRYAWKLENVHRLATPLECRGMQGFWDITIPQDRILTLEEDLF